MNQILIVLGKLVIIVSRLLNFGHGSTWPGHIALSINKSFIKDFLKTKDQQPKTILIAGTNGKTTTGKMIQIILERANKKVFQNQAGANLLNGIASSLISNATLLGNLPYDFAIFEVDENTLPLALNEISPDYLILLNLFRDQLDRYGEVNTIADKWKKALTRLSKKTVLMVNADDPQIAFLGKRLKNQVLYFGIDDKNAAIGEHQHAVDSTYCPNCGNKLTYKTTYFSHLGDWECEKCGGKRPKLTFSEAPIYPLAGIYNRYNTHAAILLAKVSNISNETIEQSLRQFSPAFGRQEILVLNGKRVQLFLSKNPTSFNESLRTIKSLGAKNILLVLNDRIPDGRDVSWIWDVDFEDFIDPKMNVSVSGDRCYDLALRLKYANSLILNTKYFIQENLSEAIAFALDKTSRNDVLYVLPTYSAMLEVRKILTGKKIL